MGIESLLSGHVKEIDNIPDFNSANIEKNRDFSEIGDAEFSPDSYDINQLKDYSEIGIKDVISDKNDVDKIKNYFNIGNGDITAQDYRDFDLPNSKSFDYFAKNISDGMNNEAIKEFPKIDSTEKTDSLNAEKNIDAIQKKCIKENWPKFVKGELSSIEKGNFCEMVMDQFFSKLGWQPLLRDRVTSLDQGPHQGLDGVYEKDGKFIIVDAKANYAELGDTIDGKQMSWNWINKRLNDAVGKEKAEEIRDAHDMGNVDYESCVLRVKNPDENGIVNCIKENLNDSADVESKQKVAELEKSGDIKECLP